jgi:hypothetical protein
MPQETNKNNKMELAPLEIYYKDSPEVEPQSQKSRQADAIILPLLKQIFNEKDKGGKDIQMVKLREEFGGSMLTYVANRMVVAKDSAALKAGLAAAGVKILDSSDNGITASKDAITMVVTLRPGNETKAVIDVTL